MVKRLQIKLDEQAQAKLERIKAAWYCKGTAAIRRLIYEAADKLSKIASEDLTGGKP